jgi:hypothetical protein
MNNIEGNFCISEKVSKDISQMLPKHKIDPTKCETSICIGMFFDGTNNNKDVDYPSKSHSNVARLYDAYFADATQGYYKFYVAGVGTVFPAVGDMEPSTKGSAFGVGCEARIIFGILCVFNTISDKVLKEEFFDGGEVLALCSTGTGANKALKKILSDLGLSCGLCDAQPGLRLRFLKKCEEDLGRKIREKSSPVIKEIFIDVFGFSRGAAESRVFCSWLSEIFHENQLVGIDIRFRFLGIFDTVASAGIAGSVIDSMTNVTGPHYGWASIGNLRVGKVVKNCVHFVAMHEIRRNFPLDEIGVNGILEAGHIQIAYPGSHSDVGGGYAPGELGISVGKNDSEGDALKLSQIPLNHMFEYAKLVGVPLNKSITVDDGYDPFAVSRTLSNAFTCFIQESGTRPRRMHEWMQTYLNWRWQLGKSFERSLQMQRSSNIDKELLKDSNAQLIRDGNLLLSTGDVKVAEMHVKTAEEGKRNSIYDGKYAQQSLEIPQFDLEAVKVVNDAKAASLVSPAIASFFDNFVHDSLAGFRKSMVESSGYWRYRKAFRGTDKVLFAAQENSDVKIS